jgi:hypothetical protein
VSPEAERTAEPDQSHVPMGLRNLRKCEACGFPVSASRVLCVECEEKKWRGQLMIPPKNLVRQTAVAAASIASVSSNLTDANMTAAKLVPADLAAAPTSGASLSVAPSGILSGTLSGLTAPARVSAPETRAFAATAQAAAPAMAPRTTPAIGITGAAVARAIETGPAKAAGVSLPEPALPEPAAVTACASNGSAAPIATVSEHAPKPSTPSEPELVLSAGLAPRQSWIATNKYIVGALLVVAAVVAAVFLLR